MNDQQPHIYARRSSLGCPRRVTPEHRMDKVVAVCGGVVLTTTRSGTTVSGPTSRGDVVLEPGADQVGDAVHVLWLLVPQDADRPPVLGQDIREAAEPRVSLGLGQKVCA
jgi:hypothetical protein